MTLRRSPTETLPAAPPDERACGPEEVAAPAGIIERVLGMIEGKWKVLIVMHLTAQPVCRFGELRRKLPRITQRMLTLQLRELERDGLLTRKIYAEVPPRVEYRLTAQGRGLKGVYQAMHRWGRQHLGSLQPPSGGTGGSPASQRTPAGPASGGLTKARPRR